MTATTTTTGTATGRWVRYGTDAASALREAIVDAKGLEPLAPVTVVVPSNHLGVSARRHLARGDLGPVCGAGPGLIGVTFVTPYRLAELLGAPSLAGGGRRPVSTPVLAAAVRAALAMHPGTFGPVATHAATEAALVGAYRELRDLDEPTLDALARSSPRAAEVVRVVGSARAQLEPHWYDEEDLMASAAAAIASGVRPTDLGALIVHLPQRLTRHTAILLRGLGDATSLTVLAGTTGVAKADAEVAQSIGRLGPDLAHHLGPPPTTSVLDEVVGSEITRIITASDADDEVRAAVRVVVDAARDGTPLDRIAVLYAARQPYARLVGDHLAAADVGINGSATVSLGARVAGRTLLGLLALPATRWRRQDVFAWLTGAPVLRDGRWAPTTSWERTSRDAGVVAGREDWDRQLLHLAEGLEARGAEIDAHPDAYATANWRADRARSEAARARELRAFMLGLIDRLAAAEAPAAWSERVRWTKTLLDEVLGGPAHRADWPEAERRAAERIDLALDRLSVLDDVEGPVGLDVFTRSLAIELDGDLGRVGRFGEGVLTGPISMGVGLDLDLVVVVGMAEGTFPATLREDSLLPDEDRDAAAGALPLRTGHVERLHHQFLATLSGARRQVLCVPKGDLRRSRERVPSRWVLDVATALDAATPPSGRADDEPPRTWWSADLLGSQARWLTHLASFDAALRVATPATPQEHRLRHLLALGGPRGALADHADQVDPSGPLPAAVATVDARWSSSATRFDGNLTGTLEGLGVPSPVDQGASATTLEAWARCPHAYFLRYILRVEPVEQPEDVLQITPIDRGNLIHQALERFITEAIDEGRVPPPAQPWNLEDHERLRTIAVELCDEAMASGITGRSLFWRRDRLKIVADLDRFLVEDDHHRALHGAAPIAAELPFGRRGVPPVAYPLPDGRTIALRGMADRVDRWADGTLHVLDYKTGKIDPYRGLNADDPHQGGRHLQLAVYAMAARAATSEPDARVRADYWFTSVRGRFEKLGYDVDADVATEVSQAIGTIVDGIESGLFVPNPPGPSTSPWPECSFCDPDGLGTTELARQWERKGDDPVLAAYHALVEPALAAGHDAPPAEMVP